MHTGADIPVVEPDTLLRDALLEMTRKGLGMTTIISADGDLLGVFTDGDLRRTLDQGIDILTTPIRAVMHSGAYTMRPDQLAAQALYEMEERKITSLVIVDAGKTAGVIHLHDILRAGVA